MRLSGRVVQAAIVISIAKFVRLSGRVVQAAMAISILEKVPGSIPEGGAKMTENTENKTKAH